MKVIHAYLREILNRIAESADLEYIKENETKLIMAILGAMLLLASIVAFVVGFSWKLDLNHIVAITGTLLFCGLFMIVLLHQKISSRLGLHLMCIALMVGLLATYYVYYTRFTLIFWLIIVIMIILSNMMIQRTLFYYMIIASIAFFSASLILFPNLIIQIDLTFNFTLLVIYGCIIVSSVITNQIYQQILKKKNRMYVETLSQKDDLNQLYDEVLAHQQQLEAQNELLIHYNTEIEVKQERLRILANTDPLTGIPNRKMLLEQIDLLIELNQDTPHRFALVFIDLDNFKKINDSMGHGAGDELLIQVTDRLTDAMDERDFLGRLGGDELSILIRRQVSDEKVLGYIQELLNRLGNSFRLVDKSVLITASFGIAFWPTDARNTSDLLKAADTAMYKAKEMGKNAIQFYQHEMKNEVLYKMELENQLIEAFQREEFFVEYQPIIGVMENKMVSFEALLRWNAPGRGLVSPAEFIPLAEEIGLIGDLGEWVLRQACLKIKEVHNQFSIDIRIGVNVSAVQMKRPDFLDSVKKVIEDEGVAPNQLTFEITESVFIGNIERAVGIISNLKAFGVMISLDDFGTGYSSLSYLMQLPIDILKIDRAFINALEKEGRNNRLVGSIIEMVHSLDVFVVAEGVEEKSQYDFLLQKKCDWIQGYLLSRPLGDVAMAAYIKKQGWKQGKE